MRCSNSIEEVLSFCDQSEYWVVRLLKRANMLNLVLNRPTFAMGQGPSLFLQYQTSFGASLNVKVASLRRPTAAIHSPFSLYCYIALPSLLSITRCLERFWQLQDAQRFTWVHCSKKLQTVAMRGTPRALQQKMFVLYSWHFAYSFVKSSLTLSSYLSTCRFRNKTSFAIFLFALPWRLFGWTHRSSKSSMEESLLFVLLKMPNRSAASQSSISLA